MVFGKFKFAHVFEKFAVSPIVHQRVEDNSLDWRGNVLFCSFNQLISYRSQTLFELTQPLQGQLT